MKNFDLNAFGVEEMSVQHMQLIDGGNIFVDAWDWIVNAVSDIGKWLAGAASAVADHVKKEVYEEIEDDTLKYIQTYGAF